MTFTKSLATLSLVAVAIAGCSRNDEPAPIVGSAEAGTACVNAASQAYGVGLEYITLGALTEDPTGAQFFAYSGAAEINSGTTTNFYCRLDADKNFVDVVTVDSGA